MKQTRPRTLSWLGLVTLILSLLALAPPSVRADGAPLPPYGREADVDMPGQKAIILYDAERGREELILSVQLLSEGADAAWVVPVPSRPEVSAASAEWFVQLSDLTQPEIKMRLNVIPLMGAGAAEDGSPGVELLSRERVGAYDVSVLAAEEPGALLDWLDENGYAFPEEGLPILDNYVQEGWYFMATRVLPGESARLDGDVQPLWLSFETARPVYPMRLTALVDDYIDVLIYVLSDHRVEVEDVSFEVEFAGRLRLEPEPSETGGLGERLTGREYYVTKLRSSDYAAWRATEDIYFRQAPNDEPYRRVVYRYYNEGWPCCCWPVLCFGVVIVTVAGFGVVVVGLLGVQRLGRKLR